MSSLTLCISKMMIFKFLFVKDWLVFLFFLLYFLSPSHIIYEFSHLSCNDNFFLQYFFIQRSSFQHHWEKYMQADMGFNDFDFVYPAVPEQPLDNKLVHSISNYFLCILSVLYEILFNFFHIALYLCTAAPIPGYMQWCSLNTGPHEYLLCVIHSVRRTFQI